MIRLVALQQSTVFRSFFAAPFALLLTLFLFYILAKLTSIGELRLPTVQDVPIFDFILARQESDFELIKRQRPPLPDEIIQPEKPVLSQPSLSEALSLDMTNKSIDAPNIDMNINIDLSSALENLNSSALNTQMFTVNVALDTSPTVLKRANTRYPPRALRKKIEGYVLVEFTVLKTGYVQADSVKVIESLPEGVFDKTVLRSIKRWRFKIKTEDGVAVTYKARQPLEFKLDN